MLVLECIGACGGVHRCVVEYIDVWWSTCVFLVLHTQRGRESERERERERKRERHTDRQTDRQTESERETERDRERVRKRGRECRMHDLCTSRYERALQRNTFDVCINTSNVCIDTLERVHKHLERVHRHLQCVRELQHQCR